MPAEDRRAGHGRIHEPFLALQRKYEKCVNNPGQDSNGEGVYSGQVLHLLGSGREIVLITLADSSLIQLFERVDPDFIGVIGILTVVMAFVFSIVLVVTSARAIQNITLARMHRSMINDLLDRGFAIDEIQQLLNGREKGVFARFFDARRPECFSRRPSPPVKAHV